MSPETEQQYKNQIAALYAEIEKLQFGQVICFSRYFPRTISNLSLFNILFAFNKALCLALLFGFKGVAVKYITFFRISSGERKPSHSFTILIQYALFQRLLTFATLFIP
ncbi:MAG: hypothetical protein J6R67_10970 [Treponema sp.]|nr:hypothetical protein [Treponema sp.]